MKRYTITFTGSIMCLLLILVVPEEWPTVLLYITGLWMGALSTIDVEYEHLKPKVLRRNTRKVYVLEPRSKLNKYI